MSHKLPFFQVLREGLTLPVLRGKEMMKIVVPAIVMGVGFLVLASGLVGPGLNDFFPVGWIAILAYLLWSLGAVVAAHRAFIMGPQGANTKWLNWSGFEWAYLGQGILIGLIVLPLWVLGGLTMALVTVPTSLAGWMGASFALMALFIFGCSYVVSRLSVALPAVAVDNSYAGMGWAWRVSAGNGLRLTVLLVGVPMLLESLFLMLPLGDSWLALSVGMFFALYLSAVEVALLSASYKYFASREDI